PRRVTTVSVKAASGEEEEDDADEDVDSAQRATSGRALLRRRVDVDDNGPDQRGRKVLGSLVGHLTSARQRLQVDLRSRVVLSAAAVAAAAAAADVLPAEGSAASRPAARSAAKAKAKHRIGQLLVQRRALVKSAPEKEMHMLQERLAEHYSHMQHFIRTRA
ncbi:unnamed protein product, partial [Polarella glacialis]